MMRDPRLAETSKLGDESLRAAVAPFLGNTVGQGVVPFPRMKLSTYASLRAELTVVAAGKPRDDLLASYYVSEASLRALEAHWAQRLAQDAEERAEYEVRLARYTHYVCEERPKGGRGRQRWTPSKPCSVKRPAHVPWLNPVNICNHCQV